MNCSDLPANECPGCCRSQEAACESGCGGNIPCKMTCRHRQLPCKAACPPKAVGRANGPEPEEVGPPGSSPYDAVLTFSANFNCRIEGCAPNILNAGYGANLLPVRFTPAAQ